MRAAIVSAAILAGACAAPQTMVPDTAPVAARTIPEIMASIPDSDWVDLDPEHTLYLELPSGRVVIELAPAYAPNHVANIKALAREGFFDAAAVVRVQENYVAQWGRPEDAPAHTFRAARASLPAEFDRPITDDLPFVRLPDRDTYADEVGFSGNFPVARGNGRTWLAHCYGMVGAGRDVSPDSGGGGELYVTIGNAPRNLDLNVTLVGRVVAGIEHLTTLKRGTGDLGFYVTAEERTPIRTMRVAADVPLAERTRLQALRTDSASFAELVEARRNRRDEWYVHPAGAIGLCNTPLPVRAAPG